MQDGFRIQVATPSFFSGPRPSRGRRHVLARRDPSHPATLPTRPAGRASRQRTLMPAPGKLAKARRGGLKRCGLTGPECHGPSPSARGRWQVRRGGVDTVTCLAPAWPRAGALRLHEVTVAGCASVRSMEIGAFRVRVSLAGRPCPSRWGGRNWPSQMGIMGPSRHLRPAPTRDPCRSKPFATTMPPFRAHYNSRADD